MCKIIIKKIIETAGVFFRTSNWHLGPNYEPRASPGEQIIFNSNFEFQSEKNLGAALFDEK